MNWFGYTVLLGAVVMAIFVGFVFIDFYRGYKDDLKYYDEYGQNNRWYYYNHSGRPNWDVYRRKNEVYGMMAVAGLFSLIASTILWMLVFALPTLLWNDYKSYGVELAALSDGTKVSGGAFLGTGTVDEKNVFRYYEKMYDTYTFKWVPANMTDIKYTDGPPNLVTTEKCGSLPWNKDLCSVAHYTFLIPRGSIVADYTLDAK